MVETVEVGLFWDRLRRGSRRIAILTVAATAVTAVVAFVLPPWFRADASLLPPAEDDTGFGIGSLLKGIGVPGVKVPTESTPSDVYVAILKSRRLNDEIISRFDLKRTYHKALDADALRELARHARFDEDETGLITISVEDRDPRRAADMANAYVELLDRFNRDVRMTKGRRTRMFVEQRLDETRRQLRDAETDYAAYQATHKAVPITTEAASSMDAASRLYAERAALQVRLGVVEGYTRGESEERTQLEQQLAQVDRQLQAIPETGIEALRRLRDVKTLEQLYILLTGQYEQARIDEARDVATVEVLDPATPPERKSRPKRGLMIAGAFAIALGLGTTWSLLSGEPGPASREA